MTPDLKANWIQKIRAKLTQREEGGSWDRLHYFWTDGKNTSSGYMVGEQIDEMGRLLMALETAMEALKEIKEHTIHKGHCVMTEELCNEALQKIRGEE